MKKIVALALSLLMILSVSCALAEESDGFLFRNQIKWGMSQEEVKALQEGEIWLDYEVEDNAYMIEYEDIAVSKFTAKLAYCFANDQLVFASYYDFPSYDPEEDGEYLYMALNALYGEGVAISGEDIAAHMRKINSTIGESFTDLEDIYQWTVGEDTLIWQFIFEEDTLYLLYFDASFEGTPAETLNFLGL